MKSILAVLLAFLSVNILNAQWEKTACPDEYSIYSLAAKGDSVLTATGNGFFLSSDKGNSWSNIVNGLPFNLKCNAILTSGPNIYIGYDMGLYKSTDNGASFFFCENTSGEYIYDIVKFGADIYIVSSTNYDDKGGILRSSDNCISWTRITDGIDIYNLKIFAFRIIDNFLFAGTNGGIFRSSNNGTDWDEINNGLALDSYEVSFICNLNEKIFAGTTNGLYLSEDNGMNWALIGNGMPSDIWVTSILTINNDVFVGGNYGGGVFVSTDQGLNWIDNSNGLSSMQVLTLAKNETHIFFRNECSYVMVYRWYFQAKLILAFN